jgi:hypothetical protein
MNKKVFTKDYLKNELELPYSAIYDEICDNGRWSIYHICVFENDGKFYQAGYSVGATECQDESPWEYEDNIECTEVELKSVMVEKWVPVE